MLDNLHRFIVPTVAGPARLVALTSLADKDFTVAALRQAAQRGRLAALRGPDGIWRSSRKAVQAYARARHARRRRRARTDPGAPRAGTEIWPVPTPRRPAASSFSPSVRWVRNLR
jgi:hypothetical protein